MIYVDISCAGTVDQHKLTKRTNQATCSLSFQWRWLICCSLYRTGVMKGYLAVLGQHMPTHSHEKIDMAHVQPNSLKRRVYSHPQLFNDSTSVNNHNCFSPLKPFVFEYTIFECIWLFHVVPCCSHVVPAVWSP